MAKILIVDDEPEIFFLVKMMLAKYGHKITKAKNTEECFERIEGEKPDLILMDIMMPGEDGWDACKRIKENKETSDITIAMFTVRTSDDSVERSYEYAKADAHINKPFSKQVFIDKVEELLESKAT